MTTWTMDQVWAVRRMWVAGWISEELAMAPDALDAARWDSAHKLAAEARVHAVEIHPDDVRISIGHLERSTFTRPTRAWWEPLTEELELLRGSRDGEVFWSEAARRGDPFRTPGRRSPTFAAIDAPTVIDLHIDTWVTHGWNEDARRWVYTLT